MSLVDACVKALGEDAVALSKDHIAGAPGFFA